jgi:hypothetical protein
MANDKNIVAAQSTFNGFITLMKVGTIASVLAAIFVVLLIAPK